MFQTVRNWWKGGTGKVTARLFAFEFIVVVTGVLVAQALANWAQERAIPRAVVKPVVQRLVQMRCQSLGNRS